MVEVIDELDKKLLFYKKSTDNKKKRIIYLEIVDCGMKLVKHIASSIASQSGVSYEDLVQVGSIGLIKAINFFDINKNTKFRTYASYFIKGEIQHYLRDKASMIKAPRELHELIFKISNTFNRLKSQGIEDPSEEQIALSSEIPLKKVHEVMEIEAFKTTLSLDQAISNVDNEDVALIDNIPSGDYQEFLNSYENKIMIEQAIDKLPSELKKILELSYYHDLNQREISEKLNISQMQVSRNLRKALHKMYEIIKKD